MRKLAILICFLMFTVNIVYAEPVFKKDSTSKLIEIFISNSASTTGGGLTGLVYNSAGLTAYYYCSGTTATSITLATMTVGTWATGGFKEIDSTNMPGWYQFGIPNAALASGCGDDVNIHLKGAVNMVPLPFAISLVDNLESDTYAKVDTEVAAILDDTGTSGVLISDGTGTGQIDTLSGSIVNVDLADTCTAVTNGVTLANDAITDLKIAAGAITSSEAPNLDAAVTSRMATYTQPTGFLTTTFPTGTVANTTNITAGTIATVTNDVGITQAAADKVWSDAATIGGDSDAVNAIWDEALTGATHNVSTSAGKLLRLISSVTSIDGTVNDAAATTTYFISNLSNAVTDFYKDSIIVFTSGDLIGQARPISAYNGTTKRITVDEAWTSAPANTVAFTILSTHVHPVTQISAAVWDELSTGHTGAGKAGQQLWTDVDDILTKLGTPSGASMSADIAGIQSDTDNIQTRIPTALVSGRIDSSVGAMATGVVTSDAVAAGAIGSSETGEYTFTVVSSADCTNSAVLFDTNLTQTQTDHWKDSFATFTSGTLAGQTKAVTAFNGTTKCMTVKSPGFSTTPTAGDTGIIINK